MKYLLSFCCYLFILCFFIANEQLKASPLPALLVSTESDPDAFIENCINIINGDYCEAVTDMIVSGPDALLLQRYYSSKNYITGEQGGGWRILPERFLVIGKDSSGKSCMVGKDKFVWSLAFAGDRSGGILPYSGWRNVDGRTKDPLKIDIQNLALGMVNTYHKEINGQNNHQNNTLHCIGNNCELRLGDGTKRIYLKVQQLPSLCLGEELASSMAAQVSEPDFFVLQQETLPSGNHIIFSYDSEWRIISIEMKNSSQAKTISWLHFEYQFDNSNLLVKITSSDNKDLSFELTKINNFYQLTCVNGSHSIPTSYEYQGALTKKILPEGRFLEINYEEGKVKTLKAPNATTGQADAIFTFDYNPKSTTVLNALGFKTRYLFDDRSQLSAIERYDSKYHLYRVDRKFWGKNKQAGLLLAKTVEDGDNRVYFFRSFEYDKSGNVIQDRLCGNLTGKKDAYLNLSPDGKLLNVDQEECHTKTFGYTDDGFNLLKKVGDIKGNQTVYSYQPNTNLLTKKIIYDDRQSIKMRTFYSYDDCASYIKIIEDDGNEEKEHVHNYITERHIIEIKPKENLPGLGLPEVIEEKAFDKSRKEILIKKKINSYDHQTNLISTHIYDCHGQCMSSEKWTYNSHGQIVSKIDLNGKEAIFEYDQNGNRTSVFTSFENKIEVTKFNFSNQPIEITETYPERQFSQKKCYDDLGRQILSTDQFGNATSYEYDAFNRLTTVIFPEVPDENNKLVHPTFRYTYDLFGNVATIEDPKGFITSRTYNLRGDPIKIAYPNGTVECFKYDPEGSLHRSLSKDQIITVYEYDFLGRCVYEEYSKRDEKENRTSFIKGVTRSYSGFRCLYEKNGNNTKKLSYDPVGKPLTYVEYDRTASENDPESRKVEFLYNTFGQLKQRKVWFDIGPQDYSIECYEYDQLGNTTEKRIEDSQGNILLRKGYSYDINGRCTEEFVCDKGEKYRLSKTEYNAQGEPINLIDAMGQETKITIDYAYQNAFGQIVLRKKITNPIGVQSIIEFDALNRVYSVSKQDSSGTVLSSQKILYDLLGNKSCEIDDQIVDGKVIGAQKHRWVFGPMNQLEEQIEAANSDEEKKTSYHYNELGKLSKKCIPGYSNPILFTYDRFGNLEKIEYQDSRKELQISNSYRQDPFGNILWASDIQRNKVDRSYNIFNQVKKETVNDGVGSYSIEYAYDRKGRIKEIRLPDQSKIAYSYNALFGREVKRLSPKGELLYSHSYDSYDEQGKLLRENHIGYVGPQEYTYDLNGQKISSKCDFITEEYKRDSLGRVSEIISEKPAHYSYNNLSQITSEKKDTPKVYAYDSLDNRIQENEKNLIYNSLNQLVSHSNRQFTYDSQGNLLKKILDGEEKESFQNNILAQLISISKSDKTSLTYSYDPLGRLLIEKKLDASKKAISTSRFFYLGQHEIGSLTNQGAIETLKIPGLNGNELSLTSVAFELLGQTYAPIHDIAGNVVKLIEPTSREVVERYDYSAFGGETIFDSNGQTQSFSQIDNPWRFAEKRVVQSGLILFGFRFYDSQTGRWISPDPAGYADGPNLYAYLHNNPLSFLDRYGLATEANTRKQFEDYFYGEVENHCFCERHRTCKRGGDLALTAKNEIPKITYDDEFENRYPKFEQSKTYDLMSLIKENRENDEVEKLGQVKSLPENLRIGFINGIWNNFDGSIESAAHVAKLSGGYNIHAVYNATHGSCVDLKECKMGRDHIATYPVRLLHKLWNSFFNESSSDTKFLMICHSQGAIHVMNALVDYPKNLRERILIVAIAPGGYIYKVTCADVVHYRVSALRDPVPRTDYKGAKREAATIVDLISHPNAKILDHEFVSETYQEVIRRHINNYIISQGKNL